MAESVHLNRRGVLFVLSSPSGAGKTTISRMMLEADKDIALSISALDNIAAFQEELLREAGHIED